MKTGRTIADLAAEIMRQAETKKDLVASTADLAMTVDPETSRPELIVRGSDLEPLEIGDTAHAQIAEEAGIPKAYYDRMKAEKPALLAQNVNEWFAAKPVKRMVRTLDGRARALLSDKFRRLDNLDLAEVALPAIQEAGLEIVSCELTESRFYLKAVDRKVQRFIPRGHRMGDGSHVGFKIPSGEVCPAVMLSNSEIGLGSLSVQSGWLDGGCTNLAWVFKQGSMRKYHVGARLDVGDELYRLLTDETHAATDKALWLQFRDTVKAALDESVFDERIAAIRQTTENKIEGDVVKVVDVTAKRFSLTDGQKSSVLQHLIRGGDLSQFGLANAVTSMANEQADYDVATQMEGLGGRIIELPRHQWQELALAA